MKVVYSRTAKIVFQDNELVTKEHYDDYFENSFTEYQKIVKLHEIYGEYSLDGWTYKSIKALSYHNGKIIMKLAPGISSDKLLNKPHLFYHIGIWLGHFHNIEIIRINSYLYGDISIQHLFLDEERKIVTSIDPGLNFLSKKGYKEIDVSRVMLTIFNASLKKFKLPKKPLDFFIDGYLSEIKDSVDYSAFTFSIDKVSNDYSNKKRWKSIIKKIMIKLYLILFRYYSSERFKKNWTRSK